jgi:hypothetical protein
MGGDDGRRDTREHFARSATSTSSRNVCGRLHHLRARRLGLPRRRPRDPKGGRWGGGDTSVVASTRDKVLDLRDRNDKPSTLWRTWLYTHTSKLELAALRRGEG